MFFARKNIQSANLLFCRWQLLALIGLLSVGVLQPLSASVKCPITPYIKVGGGAWGKINDVTVSADTRVTFGPQPVSGGSWSWTGPNGYSSFSRQIAVSVKSTSNYTATYQGNGCTSNETFTVLVSSASGERTLHNVYVTFYGWYDNSPPGNAIAYPKDQGYPTLHNVATASGSYDNPGTFASDTKHGEFKVGDVIYVPYLKKYFIDEDECTGSGPLVAGWGNCETDWKKRHKYHVDLWLGGDDSANEKALLKCEDALTSNGPDATIILNPPSDEPVDSAPLFNSSTSGCENITPP